MRRTLCLSASLKERKLVESQDMLVKLGHRPKKTGSEQDET